MNYTRRMRHPYLSTLPLELRGYQHVDRGLRQRCHLYRSWSPAKIVQYEVLVDRG